MKNIGNLYLLFVIVPLIAPIAVHALGGRPVSSAVISKDKNSLSFKVTSQANRLALDKCSNNQCEPVIISAEMQNAYKSGSENISFKDLNRDGADEVLLSSGHDTNKCYKVFEFDAQANTLASMAGVRDELCNFRVENGFLVSAFRADAAWQEDVYLINNNRIEYLYTDKCVGCADEIKRIYSDKKTVLVTQKKEIAERKSVRASVKSKKAYLYNKPEKSSQTKMYLVAGDGVTLLDYKLHQGVDWFFVQYEKQKGGVISKWMDCADLDYCD